MSIETQLTNYITHDLLSDKGEVQLGPSDNLLLSGLIDSFGVMQLVQFIEQQYSIKVKPAEVTLKNFKTITAIGTFIAAKTSAGEQVSAS